MELNPSLVFIYPKDVIQITRKTDRHARWLLGKVRKQVGKEPHQPVTIEEFCGYLKMKAEDIISMLDLI